MAVKVRQKRQKKKRDDILAEFVYNRGSVSKMKTEKMKETGEQKMKAYDYVVIGSGLYGAVFAREAVKKGKKVAGDRQTPKHRGKCIYEADGRDSCT